MGTSAHVGLVSTNLHASKEAPNILVNGGLQDWSNGVSSQPDNFVDEGTPTVARDTGERDNWNATPYSVKYTATGAGNEGGKYTFSNLKANTKYGVHIRAKATSGDTARILTTGASTNIDTETLLTVWTDLYGTFETDGTPTDVVLKLVAKAAGDIVWFAKIMVVEGDVIPTFAPRFGGISPAADLEINSLGVGLAATGTQGQIKMLSALGQDCILTMRAPDTILTHQIDLYLESDNISAMYDTLVLQGDADNVSLFYIRGRISELRLGDNDPVATLNEGILQFIDAEGIFRITTEDDGEINIGYGSNWLKINESGGKEFAFELSDATDSSFEVLTMRRLDISSPSLSSTGYIAYSMSDDTTPTTPEETGRMTWSTTDISTGSFDGKFTWAVAINGAMTSIFNVLGNGINVDKGVFFLKEQAAAESDIAGKGQVFVKNTTPNELWFRDDAGTEFQLGVPAGAGDTIERTFTETGHSFAAKDVVRFNGTNWVKAQGDSAANSESPWVVKSVSGNDFTAVWSGYISGLSGLTAGTVYFLDDDTVGLLTTTEPTDIDDVSKPMLIALSTTTGVVLNQRGMIVTGGTTYWDEIRDADNDTGIRAEQSADEDKLRFRTAGSERMQIDNTGAVFMPDVYSDLVTADIDVVMQSDGQLGSDISSIKYKTNIREINDISWIYNLHPVLYDKKDGRGKDIIGLIAEEVNEINQKMICYKRIIDENRIISQDLTQPETVVKSRLIIPILKALQDLKRDLDSHIAS